MNIPDFYNNQPSISRSANFGIRPPITILKINNLQVAKIENVKLLSLTYRRLYLNFDRHTLLIINSKQLSL